MNKNIIILKERIENEKRVILTPKQVRELCDLGYSVYVEKGAGKECNYYDTEYHNNGAKILNTEQAWLKKGLHLKYKQPIESEYKYLNKEIILGALYHAEGNHELLDILIKSGVTAYSFEFFKTNDDYYPLAFPGGEIAGKMAVLYASYFLQNHLGGKGKILTKVTGITSSIVGIIGFGNVGTAAAQMAVRLGCKVIVFSNNVVRDKKIAKSISEDIEILDNEQVTFRKYLPQLDVLVGAILISTYDTDPIITDDLFKLISAGSVVIDVTCGYGSGYMPCINKKTTLLNPTQIIDDKICIKIDNLPSSVHTSTVEAYSQNLLPYVIKLAESVFDSSCIDEVSRNGLIAENHELKHNVLKQHYQFYRDEEN